MLWYFLLCWGEGTGSPQGGLRIWGWNQKPATVMWIHRQQGCSLLVLSRAEVLDLCLSYLVLESLPKHKHLFLPLSAVGELRGGSCGHKGGWYLASDGVLELQVGHQEFWYMHPPPTPGWAP